MVNPLTTNVPIIKKSINWLAKQMMVVNSLNSILRNDLVIGKQKNISLGKIQVFRGHNKNWIPWNVTFNEIIAKTHFTKYLEVRACHHKISFTQIYHYVKQPFWGNGKNTNLTRSKQKLGSDARNVIKKERRKVFKRGEKLVTMWLKYHKAEHNNDQFLDSI